MDTTSRQSHHLYLTGYRGCGKSTVAQQLAQRLSLPVVDLDERIETRAGTTISQIFADQSEEAFRDMESACLAEVAGQDRCIVSLGGGAILRETNRTVIQSSGWCVWLDADPKVLAARLAGDVTTGDRRPSLTGQPVLEEIATVMQARESLYREVADLRIDTSAMSIDEIVEQILKANPTTTGVADTRS
ncbi:shikimate kinase [Neorhodopirellula lusitana]|uniref:Shikimate kinase n=1 Tax=Neorhodopirellula lusitana TaxID=445327 RepID=A0ABY1QIU1_9BACT|nr:shikimate kinase [Neorhodopirellula lusitana]SMP69819.1 shikimate kinase [Neorhodopirellula lusitana]